MTALEPMAPKMRQNEALHLRTLGRTYREIAAELGYSNPAAAHRATRKALNRQPAEDAALLRRVESEKLDWLEQKMHDQLDMDHVLVSHGRLIEGVTDHGPKFQAASILVRIAERRAKLHGLDAPVQVDTSVLVDVESLVARVRALRGEPLALDPVLEVEESDELDDEGES